MGAFFWYIKLTCGKACLGGRAITDTTRFMWPLKGLFPRCLSLSHPVSMGRVKAFTSFEAKWRWPRTALGPYGVDTLMASHYFYFGNVITHFHVWWMRISITGPLFIYIYRICYIVMVFTDGRWMRCTDIHGNELCNLQVLYSTLLLRVKTQKV